MRNRYITLLMLILSSTFASVTIAEETLNASVDRAWGLLLGDEVNVKIDLTILDVGIDESSLPQKGKRYGTWLYLKEIDTGADSLVFHYQVVNVPTKNTSIETPKFDVKQQDEKWIVIPSIPLTIGPSLAVTDGGANIVAKPDMTPMLIPTVEIEKQLKLFSIIAILSGIVLALWHFGWKTKNRQPFAQAVHDLSRLTWHTVTPDQAARILHSAFNHTSGTVVVYGELDILLKQCPWLMPLQQDIELFYEQSREHFFARDAQQGPDIDDVRKLAKACRSKEMLA
ncbi:MAG: hypothetical protein ACKE8G_04230 [Methylophagaceae bacterium]